MGNIGNTHLMDHSPYGRQLFLMIRGDLEWVPSHTLPSVLFWEDDQAWEMFSQASPTPRWPPRWTHNPYLVNIFWLAYLSIISLAGSKSVHTKMLGIKSEKYTTLWRISKAEDPVKNDAKWTRIEWDMLNFYPGGRQASQLTTWIDGIDGTFLFGNSVASRVHPGMQPLPLVFGGYPGEWGLSPFINILF